MGYDSFTTTSPRTCGGAPQSVSANITSQCSTDLPRGLTGFRRCYRYAAGSRFLPQPRPRYTRISAIRTISAVAGIQRELPRECCSYGLCRYEGYAPVRFRGRQSAGDSGIAGRLRLRCHHASQFAPRSRRVRAHRTNGGSSTTFAQYELKRRFERASALRPRILLQGDWTTAGDLQLRRAHPRCRTIRSVVLRGLQIDRAVGSSTARTAWFSPTSIIAIHEIARRCGWTCARGWQIAGLTTYESGVPYSVFKRPGADGSPPAPMIADVNPTGQAGVRAVPNRTSPTGYVTRTTTTRPSIRAGALHRHRRQRRHSPTPAATSDEQRTGPGLKNWDVNVVKISSCPSGSPGLPRRFYNIWTRR